MFNHNRNISHRKQPEKVRSVAGERQAGTDLALRQLPGRREAGFGSGGSVADGGDVGEKSGAFGPWVGGEGGGRLGVKVALLLLVLGSFGFEFGSERRRRG